MNLGIAAAGWQYVAKMDDDNWYGPHYLSDLVRAFSWTDAQVVGKWAHYVHLQRSNATLLRFPEAEHRYANLVQGGTILAPRSVLQDYRWRTCLGGWTRRSWKRSSSRRKGLQRRPLQLHLHSLTLQQWTYLVHQ